MATKKFMTNLKDLMFDPKIRKAVRCDDLYIDGKGFISNRHWMICLCPSQFELIHEHIAQNGIKIPLKEPSTFKMTTQWVGIGNEAHLPRLSELYYQVLKEGNREAVFTKSSDTMITTMVNGKKVSVDVYRITVRIGAARVKKFCYRKDYMDRLMTLVEVGKDVVMRHSGFKDDPLVIPGDMVTAILMPIRTEGTDYQRL